VRPQAVLGQSELALNNSFSAERATSSPEFMLGVRSHLNSALRQCQGTNRSPKSCKLLQRIRRPPSEASAAGQGDWRIEAVARAWDSQLCPCLSSGRSDSTSSVRSHWLFIGLGESSNCRADQLQSRSPVTLQEKLVSNETMVNWYPNSLLAVFPRIFAIVWTLSSIINRGGKELDLSG
jgi:hypothetical protein